MKDPHWKVLGQRTVYESSWVRVRRDDIQLPDGSVIDGHHVIETRGPAVGVVPVGDDGRVLLIEHYRFISDTTGWEIPAGGFEPGDDVTTAAARELLEETGHTARSFEKLAHYHPINGLCDQVFHIVIARALAKAGDTNEVIRADWFTSQQIDELIDQNQILDGLSLTALLWWRRMK
jgi:8-oxo-dGTP pyrophosphatase MutT (NUDIX family)